MKDSTLLAAVRAAAQPVDAAPAAAAVPAGVPQAEHDRAVAATREEALAAGRAEGAALERARIAAILDDESAKGRETLARHFAFATAMSPEDAKTALSAAPVAAAAQQAPALFQEMAAVKQTSLGADGGAPKAMNDYEKGAAEARALLGK